MQSLRQTFISLAAMTCCLAASLVHAQETSSVSPTQDDLTSVENAITQSKVKQQDLRAAHDTALREQDEMSNHLVALAQTTVDQQQALALAEKRLQKLAHEVAKTNLSLARRRDELSLLLAGLQRLQQDPPPALVVSPNDVLQALRGAMMFSAVVPELRQRADGIKAELQSLNALKEKLQTETREHAAALEALAKSKSEITSLMAQKQQAAETANTELAEERRNADALALKAETLRDLLAQLEKARLKAEAEQAAQNAKLAAQEAKRLAEQTARELAAQTPFSKSRGTIQFPVVGTVVKQFGSDTGLGHAMPGLALQTIAHAQVIAPVSGKIEFAGPFRSYGGLVIINPGEGYLVLLAGMDKIMTSTGQSVKLGEPLGEMGLKSAELAISNDLTNQNIPVLYVEFRKNTNPIDPSPWWASNNQEAQK